MHMVNAPISSVDFENLKLARKAAYYDQATGDCFVDLHNAGYIILTILKPYLPLIFCPIQVEQWLVNTRQVLVNDSFATVKSLPHRNVPNCVPSDHKVVNFTQAVHRMILVDVRDVWIIQCVFYVRQEVVVSWGHAWILKIALFLFIFKYWSAI